MKWTLAILGLALVCAAPVLGQTAAPGPGLPRDVVGPANARVHNLTFSKDARAAPAGVYGLDEGHVALQARITHLQFSYSVFRFDKVSGSLNWDPADPTRSSLSVHIDPASITSNVPGFADILRGRDFLNVAQYPGASFVSRKLTRRGSDRGTITGDLTLMGVTRPISLDAKFIGTGKDLNSVQTLGFTASTEINRRDFGLTTFAPEVMGDEVLFTIDVEFLKKG
jgi:polyisoprenoid-binding protein YceI